MRRILILFFIISTIIFAIPKVEINIGLATRHISSNDFYNNNNDLLGVEVYLNKKTSLQLCTMNNSFFHESQVITVNYYHKNYFVGLGASKGYKKIDRIYHGNDYLEVKTPLVNNNGIGAVIITGYKQNINENLSVKYVILNKAISVILSVKL